MLLVRALFSKPTKTLVDTHFRYIGKKRNTRTLHDVYETRERDKLVYVATDRETAFNNRLLASVPFKGQAMNQISQWWFEHTKDIVDNAVMGTPDPRVTIMRKTKTLPFDLVVRRYQHTNIVVPIPKWGNRWVSEHDLVSTGVLTKSEWDTLSHNALRLFSFAQNEVTQRGLLLVDTKYRFGRDLDNETQFYLTGGELHTPGNSRYWLLNTYESNLQNGLEPERLWLDTDSHHNPHTDPVLPEAPERWIRKLSTQYIDMYETITGNTFVPSNPEGIEQTILEALY